MAETSLAVLAWIGVVALIVVGVLGAVVPILPGAVFVFAGIALGAWIDDFTRVSGTVVIIAAVLMALAWIVDYLSAMLGAQRVGASRQAVIGALIGTVAGVFTGLWWAPRWANSSRCATCREPARSVSPPGSA